jgi:hypothetical protein
MVHLVIASIMVFSRCPSAQSALEIRFDNPILVDILPVVECSDPECSFSVVGNMDCSPGMQVPRGFYLTELIPPHCDIYILLLFGESLTNFAKRIITYVVFDLITGGAIK